LFLDSSHRGVGILSPDRPPLATFKIDDLAKVIGIG
jgi:hypothetical protein